jgi:hypothetical protein
VGLKKNRLQKFYQLPPSMFHWLERHLRLVPVIFSGPHANGQAAKPPVTVMPLPPT